jgi:hypothetical protein
MTKKKKKKTKKKAKKKKKKVVKKKVVKKKKKKRDSRPQINIRPSAYEAEDWRGASDALGMAVTNFIREAIREKLEDLANSGVRWRATKPGKIKKGRPTNRSLGLEETT